MRSPLFLLALTVACTPVPDAASADPDSAAPVPDGPLAEAHLHDLHDDELIVPETVSLMEVAAPARQPSPAKTEALLSLTRSLLRPDLVAPRPTLGLDVADRLHLPLAHGELRGSATLDAHAAGFPTVTVAFQTGARAASSVAELRQQVADVLNDDLRAELSRDDHALYPHSGVPSAGLAQLDTAAGYGLQFPFLYAYSGRDSLVLVFQEIPHETEGE